MQCAGKNVAIGELEGPRAEEEGCGIGDVDVVAEGERTGVGVDSGDRRAGGNAVAANDEANLDFREIVDRHGIADEAEAEQVVLGDGNVLIERDRATGLIDASHPQVGWQACNTVDQHAHVDAGGVGDLHAGGRDRGPSEAEGDEVTIGDDQRAREPDDRIGEDLSDRLARVDTVEGHRGTHRGNGGVVDAEERCIDLGGCVDEVEAEQSGVSHVHDPGEHQLIADQREHSLAGGDTVDLDGDASQVGVEVVLKGDHASVEAEAEEIAVADRGRLIERHRAAEGIDSRHPEVSWQPSDAVDQRANGDAARIGNPDAGGGNGRPSEVEAEEVAVADDNRSRQADHVVGKDLHDSQPGSDPVERDIHADGRDRGIVYTEQFGVDCVAGEVKGEQIAIGHIDATGERELIANRGDDGLAGVDAVERHRCAREIGVEVGIKRDRGCVEAKAEEIAVAERGRLVERDGAAGGIHLKNPQRRGEASDAIDERACNDASCVGNPHTGCGDGGSRKIEAEEVAIGNADVAAQPNGGARHNLGHRHAGIHAVDRDRGTDGGHGGVVDANLVGGHGSPGKGKPEHVAVGHFQSIGERDDVGRNRHHRLARSNTVDGHSSADKLGIEVAGVDRDINGGRPETDDRCAVDSHRRVEGDDVAERVDRGDTGTGRDAVNRHECVEGNRGRVGHDKVAGGHRGRIRQVKRDQPEVCQSHADVGGEGDTIRRAVDARNRHACGSAVNRDCGANLNHRRVGDGNRCRGGSVAEAEGIAEGHRHRSADFDNVGVHAEHRASHRAVRKRDGHSGLNDAWICNGDERRCQRRASRDPEGKQGTVAERDIPVERERTGARVDADHDSAKHAVLVEHLDAIGDNGDVVDLHGGSVGDIASDGGGNPDRVCASPHDNGGDTIDVLRDANDLAVNTIRNSGCAGDRFVGSGHERGNAGRLSNGAGDGLLFALHNSGQAVDDRSNAGGSLIDTVYDGLAADALTNDFERDRRGVAQRVGRPGQHVAIGIEQLDHRVESGGGVVDVDPDLAAGVAGEAIHVGVGGVVVADRAMHLKAEAAVVVATHLLSRLP